VFLAAAFLAAQRFFKAATIAALPAELSLRFALFAGRFDTSVPLIAAHLFL
jgi:hypothetical protein